MRQLPVIMDKHTLHRIYLILFVKSPRTPCAVITNPSLGNPRLVYTSYLILSLGHVANSVRKDKNTSA